MGIDEYEERYCGAHLDAIAPQRADFLAGMRRNVALLREWMGAR
jgi:hypothetical protein